MIERARSQKLLMAVAIVSVPLATAGRSLGEDRGGTSNTRQAETLEAAEARVAPSVVRVTTRHSWFFPRFDRFDDFIGREHFSIFDPDCVADVRTSTGVIFDARGYVLTATEEPGLLDEFSVTLPAGQTCKATLKGRDGETGLTVLALEGAPANLPVASLSDETSTEVSLLTSGHHARGWLAPNKAHTAFNTIGALREEANGAPIIDSRGRVVAICRDTISSSTCRLGPVFNPVSSAQVVTGDLARDIAHQLAERARVTAGWLGVRCEEMSWPLMWPLLFSEVRHGLLVKEIEPGSPASKFGMKKGDFIVACEGRPIESLCAFEKRLRAAGPGKKVAIDVARDGKWHGLLVELGERRTEPTVASD